MCTLVTCLFDIGREAKGDGRGIDQYLKWFSDTLKINCPMYIITEEKFSQYVKDNRPASYQTELRIIKFSDLKYYHHIDRMKDILNSTAYRVKIQYPERVECKIPEYNIIQYSKFHCLEMCITDNPFDSTHFFWVDAGVSRFFYGIDPSCPFPGKKGIEYIEKNKDKFIIQERGDILSYNINDNFIWGAENLLIGTMFGGTAAAIDSVAKAVNDMFIVLLANNELNNEQLLLALVWKQHPSLFTLFPPIKGLHLSMIPLLSI